MKAAPCSSVTLRKEQKEVKVSGFSCVPCSYALVG